MEKDQRNLSIRERALITFYITVLMWWVAMLAQFLWNWVKQLSNFRTAEVYIANVSAQIALVLLVHTRKKKKNF